MSVNKVILIGRLGNDPELRNIPSGASVANFNLATNESWVDKSGQKQERTEWHRIVVWGKQGELCKQYLSKGRQVYIEGRLQTRQWEDQAGQKKYTTEVLANSVRFLGSGASRDSAGASDQYGAGAAAGTEFSPGAATQEPSFTEDDIPF